MDDACLKVTAKDARRQAIIEIAHQIFVDGGYATASMSAIAARVGGSKGTLYNYFASKEELFAAVTQDHCERKLAALYDGVQSSSSDVAAGLRIIGRRYATLVLADETLRFMRMVIAEALRFPELGRFMYEAGPKMTATRLAAYLQVQMDGGRLRQTDPKRAAHQFLELCLAGLYRQRLWNAIEPPSAKTIHDNVEAGVDTFMAAFAAREVAPT